MKDRKTKTKPSFIHKIKLWSILIIILIGLIVVGYNAISSYLRFQWDSERLEQRELQREKENAKSKVEFTVDKINQQEKFLQDRLAHLLQTKLNLALNQIRLIFLKYDSPKQSQILAEIKAELAKIDFSPSQGYYFIITSSGELEYIYSNLDSQAQLPKIFDATLMQKIKNDIATTGFHRIDLGQLTHSAEDNLCHSIFFKKLPPLGITLGMGMSTCEIIAQSRHDILQTISQYRFDEEGYIFVNDFAGNAIIHNGEFVEKSQKLWETNPAQEELLRDLFAKELAAIESPAGDFITYQFPKLGEPHEFIDKTSFVTAIPELEWIVGAGVYLDDIRENIEQLKKREIERFLINLLYLISFYFIIIVLFLILIENYSRKLQRDYHSLTNFFDSLATSPQTIQRDQLIFSEIDTIATNANNMLSQRLQAEQALYNEKEELLVTIDSIQSGVITTDSNGKIILMNKIALQLCGWENSDKRHISEIGKFYNSRTEEIITNPVLQVLQSQQNIKKIYGYKLVTAEEKSYQISYSASALRNAQHQIFGTVLAFQDITNDYHLKEELKRSERRYRKLLHTTSEGFVQVDNKFRITDLNQTLCTMLSHKRNDILGKIVTDYIVFQNPAEADLLVEKFRKTEAIFTEFRLKVADDKILEVLVNATPLWDENENHLGYFAFLTDISQMKKIEKALIKSENYLLSIFNAMTDILIELDKNGKYLYIAPTSHNLLIKPPQELLGKTIFEVMPPELATSIQSKIKETLQDRQIHTLQYWLILNGKKTWFECKIAPKTDETVLYIGRDITEQKAAEAQLIASEKRYKYLFDQSPTSIWEEDFSAAKEYLNHLQEIGVKNIQAYFEENPQELTRCTSLVKVLDVNNKTLEIFNAKEKKDLTQNLTKILSEKGIQFFIKQLVSYANNEQEFINETVNKTYDGREINVLIRSNVVPGYEKTYAKVLVSLIDITQQKRKDQRLARNLQEKNTLLKELYHRTKNNMQIISSMLRLKSAQCKDANVIETFNSINNKIQAMSLVHKKLYQNKDLSQINLKEYIEDLVNLLIRSYHIDSEFVSLEYRMEDIYIMMDSAIPLGLCLNELITNSFKYAFQPRQKGKLFISLQRNGKYINLKIGDSGRVEIDDFDPQRSASMGLKTVYNLVENQLNGTIDFSIDAGLWWNIKFVDNQYESRV
ncbi:MAG: PAS domain S-box protein [Candidatus Cloacimonadales bacterium]